MFHFKTLLLLIIAVVARTSFAQEACEKVVQIAAIKCYDEAQHVAPIQEAFTDRENVAEDYATTYAAAYPACEKAFLACRDVCKLEQKKFRDAGDREMANRIIATSAPCDEQGAIGISRKDMQMAAYFAKQELGAVSKGRLEAGSTPAQGMPTSPFTLGPLIGF